MEAAWNPMTDHPNMYTIEEATKVTVEKIPDVCPNQKPTWYWQTLGHFWATLSGQVGK
ncbi:hypothetical protein P691DRAFT_800889 [Macrolepiota fuliginosa MF-IS2]|uniref:Uncharacterized protein n=1 Tax=Macrolepiota fuliginosa MF-IS2 TaxID=1400762 RepID=A0A9P5XEL7_9AGAR|nr:hypothetical protein P691DRAFT_800889 [Macrolepiota fuliginosa MF-IS2]